MSRPGAQLLACGFLLAGCAGGTGSSVSTASIAPASPSEVTSAEPSAADAAIVGVWRGEHECEGIADALGEAGFDESVILENIVGNGLVPGAESPDDVAGVADACEEATILEHSHEFTADGEFFSYDQDGNEVDFGTYELVDDDTLTIGAPDRPGVTFDFTIEGDHLTLEPQVEPGCMEFECMWAVMVAMPWSGMERVVKSVESQEPTLRLAVREDVDAIDALMKASTAVIFPRFYSQAETDASVKYIASVDRTLVDDGTYFVFEVEGEIVACGGWSRRDKLYTGSGHAAEGSRHLDPAVEPARVRAMFVRDDWTRRGLGTRMLEACQAAAKAEGFQRLALGATLPGVPLYERFGFVATNDMTVAMPDGTTIAAVAMVKPIL